jgi:hypothetical protein
MGCRLLQLQLESSKRFGVRFRGIQAWPGGQGIRPFADCLYHAILKAQGAPSPVPPLAESGIDLGARGIVNVEEGYHGGRFVGRSMSGYLQQDGWTEAGCPLPWG